MRKNQFKIYRNLHKDCFSVLKYNQEKKGYRLFAHEKDLVCHDVNFTISKAGRDRVLLEKKKMYMHLLFVKIILPLLVNQN